MFYTMLDRYRYSDSILYVGNSIHLDPVVVLVFDSHIQRFNQPCPPSSGRDGLNQPNQPNVAALAL